MVNDADMRHLLRCVELAAAALAAGDEPFGSVLVAADGTVLFEDHNHVAGGDHTRHPEFEIARWAAAHMSPEERRQATVFTSGEHCPMCAAAHGWVGTRTHRLCELVRAALCMARPRWRFPLHRFARCRSGRSFPRPWSTARCRSSRRRYANCSAASIAPPEPVGSGALDPSGSAPACPARAPRRPRRLPRLPRLPGARGRGDRGGRLGAGGDRGRPRPRGRGAARRRRRDRVHLPLRRPRRARLDGGERARGLRDRRLPLARRHRRRASARWCRSRPSTTATRSTARVALAGGGSLDAAPSPRATACPGSSPSACSSTASASRPATALTLGTRDVPPRRTPSRRVPDAAAAAPSPSARG